MGVLEFADGFDSYNGAAECQLRWDLAYAAPSLGNGRYAGSGCNGSGPGNTMTSTVSRTVVAAATRSMGFAFKANSLTTLSVAQLMDGGTIQFEIYLNSNGTISIYTGGVARAVSTNAIVAGQWYYIEMWATFGPSGPTNVFVNGSQWTGYAGANNTSGRNQATAIKFTPNGNYIDDVYTRNGDALTYGEISVVADTPSADSSNSGDMQWSPNSGSTHYSRVNEQDMDGDTSYVSTPTANLWDLFRFNARTLSGANTIAGIIATAIARKDDTAARNIQLGAKQNIAAGGSPYALTQNYAAYQQVWETNPAISGNPNWTGNDIGAAGTMFGVVSG